MVVMRLQPVHRYATTKRKRLNSRLVPPFLKMDAVILRRLLEYGSVPKKRFISKMRIDGDIAATSGRKNVSSPLP